MSRNIDMTGVWLVHYGIHNKLEGSEIVTINGFFKPEEIVNAVADNIKSSMPEEAKKLIKENGPLVIRCMNRLSIHAQEQG